MQDSSSVKTFKAVLDVLEEVSVRAFILENVDMTEEEDSNFSIIVQALSHAGSGYQVKAFKLWATDFGLPQRRCRLYFIGIRKGDGEANMDSIESMLRGLRLKKQFPETWFSFSSEVLIYALCSRFVQPILSLFVGFKKKRIRN